MINSFLGTLRSKYTFLSGFTNAKRLLRLNYVNRTSKTLKLFSDSKVNSQKHRYNGLEKSKRQLPSLFFIQNPITWLINKIDFMMLRSAWDAEFAEDEFKAGVKQAVSVICCLISNNLWSNLRGLITSNTLTRLQREVEISWGEEQKKIIAIEPSDIKLVLPRKVHFLRIADQKFVDVDVICVAVKFKEKHFQKDADIVLVEVLARFHRNYTAGQLPNWTVSLFKVTYQNVKSKPENKRF